MDRGSARRGRAALFLHRVTVVDEPAQQQRPASPPRARAPRTWDIWLASAIGAAAGIYGADQVARLFLLY